MHGCLIHPLSTQDIVRQGRRHGRGYDGASAVRFHHRL